MKKKPEVKFVWFDVGNVIVRASHEITHAILRDLGVAPDRASLFFSCQAYREFSRGAIDIEQFTKAMEKLLKCNLSMDELRAAHDAHIYMVDKDVREIIVTLYNRHIPICFVTNTNMWQTTRVENELIGLTSFGSVYRSHEFGKLKTDAGFWDNLLVVKRVQRDLVSSILFIDDDRNNLAWAKAAGLQTYLYDPTYGKGAKKLRAMLKRRGLL